MKIQTKITLSFFSISAIGLIVLNAVILYFVSAFNFEDFFERLEARVNLAAEINLYPDKSSAFGEVRSKYLQKLEDEKDYIMRLGPSKQPIEKLAGIPDKFYNNIIKSGSARYNEDNHFYAGSFFKTTKGDYIIIVAASDPHGFTELENLRRILFISLIISIIVAYLIGKVFSSYTVKPVRKIINSVKSISADNLHSRLPEVDGKDELAELINTFNNMLTRLETAFETQNNFVSNASHELRTPLAIITSETELMLSVPDLPDKVQLSANAILSEAGKLEQILVSLLGLAQSGFDGKKQNWQSIRVDELVMDVGNSMKKIDPESVIDIDFSQLPDDESLLYTEGNMNLLQLAISNIVINACKYSNNQPVKIGVSSENDRITVSVTDVGIGIPEGEQQHIFEPFFRASNVNTFEGYGIGLPLTLNIIRLHKGSIGIRSQEKVGTEIKILLPLCSTGENLQPNF